MTKKSPNIYYIILALGIINLALAGYDIFSGNPFDKYMFTLIIGATLTGAAIIQLRKKDNSSE